MKLFRGENGKVTGRWLLAMVLIAALMVILWVSLYVRKQPDTVAPAAVAAARSSDSAGLEVISDAAVAGRISEPLLVEFPGEATPTWRRVEAPPTLVLLSAEPFIEPIADDVGATAEPLFKMADQAEIARKVRFGISDPVLLPTQTVRLALRCGVLAGLTWIVPLPVENKPIQAEALRTWLLSLSQFSAEEKSTLRVTGEGVVGQVEGRPFRVTVLGEFTGETAPSQLHVDLSYYHSLYRNEIKTPLYPLLLTSVAQLFQSLPGLQGVTISSATANGDVPVAFRFLGPTLKTLFAEPALLQQPLSAEWMRRRDMLYLLEFQQLDKMVELAKRNVAALPEDASAYFDLYRVYLLQKNLPLSDATLSRACALDPGYTYEYRNRAVQALDREDSVSAVAYLRQALPFDDANALLKLDLARVLLKAGDVDAVRPLLRELQALPWSIIYYPRMPTYLVALISASMSPPVPSSVNQPDKQKPVLPLGHGVH